MNLTLNGKPLPGSLLANLRYELEIRATGYDPIATRWSVLLGATTVSSGTGRVLFLPSGSQTYTIHVTATSNFGFEEEAVFVVNSVTVPGAPDVSVNWTSLTYAIGEAIDAVIRVRDLSGNAPVNIRWVLYRNNLQVVGGTGPKVRYQTSTPGIYRVKVSVVDSHGNTLTADSAVYVSGGFEMQASLQPVEVAPTCVYLGALYVNELVGAGGPVTELPYQLACYSEAIYLLPGTTHVSFDLDPLQHQIDDEVVIRTQTGNYVVKGYPTGLLSEDVGYDYTTGLPMLTAPADGLLKLTVEALNVHGPVAQPFSFRVRVKCWRQGAAIYQYIRCPFSTFPGGNGQRFRSFAALFTEIEATTDVGTDLKRLGIPTSGEYSAPEVTSVPLTTLLTDGSPNPVQTPTGMFFTASNWFAVYENRNPELPELDVRAVAAQETVRPFLFTLEVPSTPPIIQRITRLKGRMVIYMNQGSILAGAVVRVRILTSKSHGGNFHVDYTVPIAATVYNNSTDTFQRVGAAVIDLSDFQFSGNGVVVLFSVDESGVTPPALPCDPPDPVVPPERIYTSVNAPGVLFDGACYSQPELQATMTAEAVANAGAITGCYENVCGPVGVYCYTNVQDGSISGNFRQPLYFPAPYVAYGSNPLDCFQNPVLVEEASGTFRQSIIMRDTTALCGDGWVYTQCSGSEQMVTVYPHNTVPHDVVSYGSECWSLAAGTNIAGSIAASLLSAGTAFVSAGSVTAVPDCLDVACTGTVANGSSVRYSDTQTEQVFSVAVENMSGLPPFIGVSAQVINSGLGNLPRGEMAVTFIRPRMPLFTCKATGQVNIRVGLFGLAKRIIVVRRGQTLTYEIGLGADSRFVGLELGDVVSIDIGNRAGLLSDRTRNLRTRVIWNPVLALPRHYHTSTVEFSGTSAITSIGFTGRTNRSVYTLYQTVPADVEQDLPNPDNIVTVQGATGGELVLVRTRAIGDPVPPMPGNTAWYAGQSLEGPLTLRFYTSREDQGSHGETDLWFDNRAGTFPTYMAAGVYRTLQVVTPVTRLDSQIGDVSRNSLRVAAAPNFYPSVYLADDGERLYIHSQEPYFIFNGKTYTKLEIDPGISGGVTAINWTTTFGEIWTTTDGEPWTV